MGKVLPQGEEVGESCHWQTGSQLLSPSPSVPPGTGNSTEMDFNEEERQMAMGMDMELDGGSMMVCLSNPTTLYEDGVLTAPGLPAITHCPI